MESPEILFSIPSLQSLPRVWDDGMLESFDFFLNRHVVIVTTQIVSYCGFRERSITSRQYDKNGAWSTLSIDAYKHSYRVESRSCRLFSLLEDVLDQFH